MTATTMENDPVVIVGLACRFPGGNDAPSKVWDFLAQSKSGQGDVPAHRFNVDGFYNPDKSAPASIHTRGGYFLQEDIRDFENDFFGINNMEATHLDPSQRKLLEVVYECFENAGIAMDSVSGSNTGCYVGNFLPDFAVVQDKDPELFSRFSATAKGVTILSNRISHAFNLKGPSMVIDTACSASIYGLHLACQSILDHSCDGAVVAGVNLIQSIEEHIATAKAGILSPSGTCRTFDISANGYGRGEAVNALYLKRLSAAVRDNDPIRAVIRGSAINSNGRTAGISLPSIDGQEAAIRAAYKNAGLDPLETAYVECHGTGTAVGDPIEVEALSRVFSPGRDSSQPLLIGSVKTNFGHGEAASGITSVIKNVLAMENDTIPATVGIECLNPKIKCDEWKVEVVAQKRSWPAWSDAQRVSINSFGYGGANAHVIIESKKSFYRRQFFDTSQGQLTNGPRLSYLFPFTANTRSSLNSYMPSLSASVSGVPVRDLAYTFGSRRSRHRTKGFLVANQDNLANQISVENLKVNEKDVTPFDLAFVFTGQGAQWPQMGKELFEEFPLFRDTVADLDDALQQLPSAPSWNLRDAMLEPAETSSIHRPSFSQPLCAALQIGLIVILRSWGIHPRAIVGHSSGEIAAAFAAGILTARQAVVTAYLRGLAVEDITVAGGMLAVSMSLEEAKQTIAENDLEGKVRIGCINSPSSITLSGDADGIEIVFNGLKAQNKFARKLPTGGKAYHSHHMQSVSGQYEAQLDAALGEVLPPSDSIRFVSTVFNREVKEGLGATYWRSNADSAVLFSPAVSQLLQDHTYHLVEIGPHATLKMPISQIAAEVPNSANTWRYSSAIIRGKNCVESLLAMVGELFLAGHQVDFAKVNDTCNETQCLVDLPHYTWHYHGTNFVESRANEEYRNRKFARHELLGAQVPGGSGLDMTWRNLLRSKDVPWLKDHKLDETVVFPAAGYCAMAIEAIRQVHGNTDSPTQATRLRHVSIQTALTLPSDEKEGIEVFTKISPQRLTARSTSDTWYHFEISSFSNGRATTHVTGHISRDTVVPEPLIEAHLGENAYTSISPTLFYQHLSQEGLVFGEKFRSLVRVQAARDAQPYSVGLTHYVPTTNAHLGSVFSYPIHPITLDAMLQASMAAGLDGKVASLRGKIPVTIGEVHVLPCPVMQETDKLKIHAVSRPSDFGYTTMSADLVSPIGLALARVSDVRLTPFNGGNQVVGDLVREPILRISWKPDVGAELTRKNARKSGWLNLFSMSATQDETSGELLEVPALLKSLCFKNPQMRVLEVFFEKPGSYAYPKSLLEKQWADYQFGNVTSGYMSEDGKIYRVLATDSSQPSAETESILSDEVHDLVILNCPRMKEPRADSLMLSLDAFLASGGLVLASDSLQLYNEPGFRMVARAEDDITSHCFSLGTREADALKFELSSKLASPVNIIKLDSDSENAEFAKELSQQLQKTGAKTIIRSCSELDSESLPNESIAICLLELHQPILAQISEEQLACIKNLMTGCSKLLWVTTSGLPSKSPEMNIIKGLSRSVMLEHPALDFFTLDVNAMELDAERLASNALYILQQPGAPLPKDFEFADVSGSLHVSRFLPDRQLNQTFRERQGLDTALKSISHHGLYKLMLTKQGRIDSAVFQEQPVMEDLPPPGFVDVHVKAIGLNSSDFSVLHGKKTTVSGTASSQLAGVVTSTGFDVDDVQIGERVLVLAPTAFQTTVRVPSWTCHKLLQNEDFETMSAIPVRFATALYALRERANLKKGESVLIHCGTSGVGDAAIQLAKRIGAEVFTTVSSEEHAEYVYLTHRIPRDHIFSCLDTGFANSLLKMTEGRGADVILSCLTGQHLHDSWRVCADFGRFIDIGRQDLADDGFLSMMPFAKSASYTALCMHCLHVRGADTSDHVTSRLLRDVLSMYRAGYITVPKTYHHVFGVDQLTEAFRFFASKGRTGTVSLSFEGHKMTTKVAPFSYAARFRSEKTYFLVGCLGGLGRSISNWMFDRGARKFLFMGRSGLDRAPAQELVHHLEAKGAIVKVVKGDVTDAEDVSNAIAGIRGQIGGVINAAMGLSEAVFMQMSAAAWRQGIDPKCLGTWNIHNALQDRENELDFFLLMSSLNGSIGSATESNYCAANSFLDAFAAYRQSRNLVCTAVGLGAIAEVGYVHDNAHAQTHMQRRGIRSLTESELLQVIDIALSSHSISRGIRKLERAPTLERVTTDLALSDGITSSCHILTGLEPFDPSTLLQLGIKQKNPVEHDPRAIHLQRRFEEVMQKSGSSSGSSASDNDLNNLCAQGAPVESILPIAAKGLAELILQPIELLDTGKSLASYGMDSMLASEYRSWFFKTFRVDVPFMDLLSASSTVTTLAKIVSEKLKVTLAQAGRVV